MFRLVVAMLLLSVPAAAQTREAKAQGGEDSVAVVVDIFTAPTSTAFKAGSAPRLVIQLMDGYSVRQSPPITGTFAPGSKTTATFMMPARLDTVKAIEIDYDPAQTQGGTWVYSRISVRRGKFPAVTCGAKEPEKEREFNSLFARTIFC